jgi:thiamine pyridinylase
MRLASRAKFGVFSVAFVALALTCATSAHAGSLLLENSGAAAVICQPADSGPSVSVPAGGSATLHPPPKSEIRSLRCGRLSFRALDLSSDSSDRELFLNGKQTRTLSAALFPYLPMPNGDFTPLIKLIVSQYQRLYPDVALELVIDLNTVKPYDFTKLPTHLGSSSDAYDALEIDTSVLKFLTDGNHITTIPAPPDPPLQVAQQAVQTGTQGLLWGVPTWICRDFFFSYDSTITGITNSDRLLAYLKILPIAPRDWPRFSMDNGLCSHCT